MALFAWHSRPALLLLNRQEPILHRDGQATPLGRNMDHALDRRKAVNDWWRGRRPSRGDEKYQAGKHRYLQPTPMRAMD
jgi:hypothetical protein